MTYHKKHEYEYSKIKNNIKINYYFNTYFYLIKLETVKRKTFSIFTGRKEYKVSQHLKRDLKRAKEKYSLLIESLFNESVSVTEDEYGTKLYDEEFVIDKIKSVITNYMS